MAQKPVLRGEVGCACVAREVSVDFRHHANQRLTSTSRFAVRPPRTGVNLASGFRGLGVKEVEIPEVRAVASLRATAGRRGHGFFESAQTRPKSPFGCPLGSQKTRSLVNWGQFGRRHRTGRFENVKKYHIGDIAARGPWARPMGPHCPSGACSLCAGEPRGFLMVCAGARDLKCASFSVCLCVYVKLH